MCNHYTTRAEKEAPRLRHLLRKPWISGIISAQRSSPPGWIARMCNHYTRNQCWFLSVSVKFLLLYGNISGFPLDFCMLWQSHMPYKFTFSLLQYTSVGLYGYNLFSSICTVFFPWLYGYNLFSFICTVFFPWLYGYHFFSFICTVFFPWLYGYHFFSFICTVFFPGLYGYYFFSFICTVFFPGLYGYYSFSPICTVFLRWLYGYYSFSFICAVFLWRLYGYYSHFFPLHRIPLQYFFKYKK